MTELEKQKLNELTTTVKKLPASEVDYLRGYIEGRVIAKKEQEDKR